jgi:hypothetical protein
MVNPVDVAVSPDGSQVALTGVGAAGIETRLPGTAVQQHVDRLTQTCPDLVLTDRPTIRWPLKTWKVIQTPGLTGRSCR